jgi:HEAT repeat protein
MEAGDEATRLGAVAVLRAADAADEVTLPALDGALTSGSPAVRRAALRALADLGPRAAPLAGRVAALLDHEDPWVGEAASAALAAMRLPVTRLEALLSAAVEQRASERAARELGGLGPAVAPAVLRLFGSPDPEVRDAALLALPGLGAAAAPAVPGLRPIVESGTRTLRERALRVAAAVGPRAAPLVPALLARLGEQRGPSPRLIAALEAIGEPAHEPLLAALRSPLDRVRMDALTVLSRFRHGARFALGALPPFSRSRSPRVRELVAVAAFASVRRTGEDGPPPPSEAHVREARALLERLAGDEDAGVRRVAGYGLQALERLRGR